MKHFPITRNSCTELKSFHTLNNTFKKLHSYRKSEAAENRKCNCHYASKTSWPLHNVNEFIILIDRILCKGYTIYDRVNWRTGAKIEKAIEIASEKRTYNGSKPRKLLKCQWFLLIFFFFVIRESDIVTETVCDLSLQMLSNYLT